MQENIFEDLWWKIEFVEYLVSKDRGYSILSGFLI